MIFLLVFNMVSALAFANENRGIEWAESRVLSRIEVDGLVKTSESVVRRELLLEPGERITAADYEESLRRLKNLQIFSKVEAAFAPDPAQRKKAILKLSLEDRWTTIPFFNARKGGGVLAIRMGVFDINVLGTYTELGLQYENLEGTHSGIVWFREPRFLGKRLRLGTDLWIRTRNRDLFQQDRTLEGAFTHRQNRARLFSDYELHPNLTLGAGTDLNWEKVDESKLSSDRKELNDKNGFKTGDSGRVHLLFLYARLGRLDYDVYRVSGQELRATLTENAEFLGSQNEFTRLSLSGKKFWSLPWQSDLGFHLRLATSNAKKIQHLYYVGGFDAVRGFRDGQFRNRHLMTSNLEYRIPSLQTPWVVLQHVLFFDAGRTSSKLGHLFNSDERIFTSIGTGIRVISPKIYSFNGRFDFAQAFGSGGGFEFSFGTQQYF